MPSPHSVSSAAGAGRSPAQAQRQRRHTDHRLWQQVAAAVLLFPAGSHHRLLRVAVSRPAASGGGALDDSMGSHLGGGLAAPPTRGTPFPLDSVRNQQVGQCVRCASALLLLCSQSTLNILQSPGGWGLPGAGGGRDLDASAMRRNKSAVAPRVLPADLTPSQQPRSKSYHRISSTPFEILPSRASPPPQNYRGSPASRGLGFGQGPEYRGGSGTSSPSISPQRQRPK